MFTEIFNLKLQLIYFVFSDYEMSRCHMIVITVLSTLLGITWLLVMIFLKQCWNLQRTDKRAEKGHQLETQSREQHCYNLQDTDVGKNYTSLDRPDQETPNEKTL